jgi:hypothetical protein
MKHGHSANSRSVVNRGAIAWHSHEGGDTEHHHQYTTDPTYHPPTRTIRFQTLGTPRTGKTTGQ